MRVPVLQSIDVLILRIQFLFLRAPGNQNFIEVDLVFMPSQNQRLVPEINLFDLPTNYFYIRLIKEVLFYEVGLIL